LGANLGRVIVTNRDFTAYMCDSASTRPSSQNTLGRLVIITITINRKQSTDLLRLSTFGWHNSSYPIHSELLKSRSVFDGQNLSFNSHTASLSGSCYFHTRTLRHLRLSVTHSVAKTLTCIIIFSRLDYCNSVFVVVLQNAHTLSAHPKLFSSGIVTNSSPSAAHTSLLHSLHRSLVVLIILSQYDESISVSH